MSRPPEQMGQLDTAETAGQAQVPSDQETAIFEQMVAGLRNHVYGKGEQGIVKRLAEAANPDEQTRALGEIVFILVQEAAHQAEEAGAEFDMDMLMGAATQLIDDIADLMEATGMALDENVKNDALMVANQLYVESSNPTDDERNAAKADLAEQRASGQLDEAVSYVQQRGAENGADPFGVKDMTSRPGMMGQAPAED